MNCGHHRLCSHCSHGRQPLREERTIGSITVPRRRTQAPDRARKRLLGRLARCRAVIVAPHQSNSRMPWLVSGRCAGRRKISPHSRHWQDAPVPVGSTVDGLARDQGIDQREVLAEGLAILFGCVKHHVFRTQRLRFFRIHCAKAKFRGYSTPWEARKNRSNGVLWLRVADLIDGKFGSQKNLTHSGPGSSHPRTRGCCSWPSETSHPP